MRTVLIFVLSICFSSAFAATEGKKVNIKELSSIAKSEKDPAKKFRAMARVMKHYSAAKIPSATLDEVEKEAKDLLKSALDNQGDPDYGNAIHHGNLVLGRIALQRGDVEGAESYLHKAGDTPSSADLISLGPNMTLAKELLQKGRKDAVLGYFDQVGKFWEYSDHDPKSNLNLWKKEASAGKIPDFRDNLTY